MKFYVREKVTIQGANEEIKKEIKEHLTIHNPAYQANIKMELPVWGIDPKLEYFEEYKKDVIIPTGAFPEILNLLKKLGIKVKQSDITDLRIETKSPEYFSKFKFNGKLRDYQQEIKDSMSEKTIGVIEAKTGSGKSFSFVDWTLSRDVNTLILVHTKELASQTIEAFIKFSNLKEEDIGFVGSGRFELKPISIGLLQTLTSLEGEKLNKVQNYFGQIIADETHIIAAETYFSAMGKLPAKYKWGFSATPKREDGLTKVIFWATGPLVHKVPKEKLEEFLMKPKYKFVFTDYYFPLFNTQEYQTMLTYMAEDEERNKFILKTFEKENKDDRPSLFLCGRASQVEWLHKNLKNSIMLTSKMTKKQRKAAMKKVRKGTAKHIISTWGLFSTGIDVPRLEFLFICSPMKSENILRQAGGRLMRTSDGKETPWIIDFVDKQIGLLMGQWKTRMKILNNL